MATGRCAGCGMVDRRGLLVREHTRYCREYAALYAEHPDRALEPEVEFVRWVIEQRADERAGRREEIIAEAGRRRAAQEDRWQTPPDILEES
jgi:hypothetical protein